MAFLLVDRITALDPGRSAQGYFTVPATMAECPAFLLAEAIGQLAGWAAMAQLEFRMRPVAALAGEVLIAGGVSGGERVDLAVHLDGVERGGVLYGGTAVSPAGSTVLELRRCVGPLLPMEEFDDPAAVRALYRELRERGLPAGGLQSIEPVPLEVVSQQDGERLVAAISIPRQAPFFAEHFPRRAVYPATILLDRKLEVARLLLRGDGGRWRMRRAAHVKISAFSLPGERLEIEAVRVGGDGDEAAVQLTGFRDGTRVSRVRMEFVRESE